MLAAILCAIAAPAAADPLDPVFILVNNTVTAIFQPVPPPPPACVGGYNPGAYSNVCYSVNNTVKSSPLLCWAPPCLDPVTNGNACIIGQVCVPILGINYEDRNMVSVRVEALCNQPGIYCICAGPPNGLGTVVLCTPFT